MNRENPLRINSIPGSPPAGGSAPPAGKNRRRAKLQRLLRSGLSCPNLAKPLDAAPAAMPAAGAQPGRERPKSKRYPESQGRAAKIGTGRKLDIQTAHNFCAVSVRIADLGLLMECSFRIAGFSFRVTSDLLEPNSWLPALKIGP
jgi:hypothetical protein